LRRIGQGHGVWHFDQMLLNGGDVAVMMWKRMIQKAIFPKSDCAAILIDGFCDLGRASEALKYSLEAITRRVQIPVETMTKLKNASRQAGKQDAYGQLEKKKKFKSISSQAK
jgi:hypothetical protein